MLKLTVVLLLIITHIFETFILVPGSSTIILIPEVKIPSEKNTVSYTKIDNLQQIRLPQGSPLFRNKNLRKSTSDVLQMHFTHTAVSEMKISTCNSTYGITSINNFRVIMLGINLPHNII